MINYLALLERDHQDAGIKNTDTHANFTVAIHQLQRKIISLETNQPLKTITNQLKLFKKESFKYWKNYHIYKSFINSMRDVKPTNRINRINLQIAKHDKAKLKNNIPPIPPYAKYDIIMKWKQSNRNLTKRTLPALKNYLITLLVLSVHLEHFNNNYYFYKLLITNHNYASTAINNGVHNYKNMLKSFKRNSISNHLTKLFSCLEDTINPIHENINLHAHQLLMVDHRVNLKLFNSNLHKWLAKYNSKHNTDFNGSATTFHASKNNASELILTKNNLNYAVNSISTFMKYLNKQQNYPIVKSTKQLAMLNTISDKKLKKLINATYQANKSTATKSHVRFNYLAKKLFNSNSDVFIKHYHGETQSKPLNLNSRDNFGNNATNHAIIRGFKRTHRSQFQKQLGLNDREYQRIKSILRNKYQQLNLFNPYPHGVTGNKWNANNSISALGLDLRNTKNNNFIKTIIRNRSS